MNNLFSVGYSWAIDTTGKCLFRSSVDSTSPWVVDTVTTLPLTYIAVGHTGEVWALTAETIPATANVWYRQGVTATNLKGTGWVNVSGILASLSVGYNGELVGVTSSGDAFFRNGFSGTWIGIGTGFKQLAIGPNGIIWALKPDKSIWVRTGITSSVPQGTGWLMADGQFTNISIGQEGGVYVVNAAGAVSKRLGITPSNAFGYGWQEMSSSPVMISVSASQNTATMWAVDTAGKYYSWIGKVWTQIIN